MLSKFLWLAAFSGFAAAEDGSQAWLRYARLPCSRSQHPNLPTKISIFNSSESSPINTAGDELKKGIRGILGKDLTIASEACDAHSAILVATVDQFAKQCGDAEVPELEADGFWLSVSSTGVQILGQNERGALYGAFEYLSMLAQGNFSNVAYATNPANQIRWVNQWDNMNDNGEHGSIERGYAGPSIFFKNWEIVEDMTRAAEYARILASIRVNAVVVNNVNANATILSPKNIKGLGRIADAFRPYGVQLGLSLNFASPKDFGGLPTFDPLDAGVISFWTNVTNQIYDVIPDFAGYLVKANSEGQPGPLTYNRTLAEGANLFARALEPHGGILMFRAFVYNNKISYSDWYADRANAAVDFFKDLDGKFNDNVVIQIKYGPIDFQIREPVSPLFANFLKTSTCIELQVTQEYLGQQSHLVYLPPMWRELLDFDLRNDGQTTLVRDVISGKRFKRPLGGMAAVVNVGTSTNWLGSHLAMSNLYAYGRLAWDPLEDSEVMLADWTRLTFGFNPAVRDTINSMSMESWSTYEKYSGNLGIQTLTDILYTHFGPNPASQDNNGWGQWTRADKTSIGMDRTVANGTKFSGQYPPEWANKFEKIETTPEELLLWFHHVKYTHKLSTGKTVIQHFYDEHYEGAEIAQTFPTRWESLKGKIDDQRYEEMLYRLKFQAGHSIVWRDAINGFYYNLSGIPDEAGRVGNHPWRIEAESMALDGYKAVNVTPPSMASGTRAIVTSSNGTVGSATTKIGVESGTYDLAVNFFDLLGGRSHYEVLVNGKTIGQWKGDNEDYLGHAHSTKLDGHSATRVTFRGVQLAKGDELKIVGTPDGIEMAPLDYVVLLPEGVVD